MAFGAGVAASYFLVRKGKSRMVVMVVATLLYVFSTYVMIPFLDDFTSGAFTERYTETSSTGREEAALIDLQLWREYPLLGVGPGRASIYRELVMNTRLAAHTEFTRILAEHGTLGILALIFLFLALWQNVKRTSSLRARALVAALISWAFLFMLVNAFRIVAPAFLLGLTFALIMDGNPYLPRVQKYDAAEKYSNAKRS